MAIHGDTWLYMAIHGHTWLVTLILMQLVQVIRWFRVQFGMKKREQIFQRLARKHERVGRVQFEVFEKFTSAYLFQIAHENSCDYLLIIYNMAPIIKCKRFLSFFQRYIVRDITLARCFWESSLAHLNLIRHFEKHEAWRTAVKRKIIAFWGTTRSPALTMY